MEYIIASSVSTDRIQLKGGGQIDNLPGGAGTFALAGLRLWSNQVIVVSGIGPEYHKRHQRWYKDNRLSTQGLTVRSNITPITTIDYRQEDDRADSPNMGLVNFRLLDPSPKEISCFCDKDTKGIYFFKHLDKDFLQAMIHIKEKIGCRLMWEISEDGAIPENRTTIEHFLKSIDSFSINKKEARALYETESTERICEIMQQYSGVTFFRQGSAGAYVVSSEQVVFIPSVSDLNVVDTTGAGNGSTAGFLYGLCQGYELWQCGCFGAVSAAAIIEQYGPPPVYTGELRRSADQRRENLEKEVKGYGGYEIPQSNAKSGTKCAGANQTITSGT